MSNLVRSLLILVVGWVSLIPGELLGQDILEELVLIRIKEDAPLMDEALFHASWLRHEREQALQAGKPHTGIAAFDSLGERYGLLWIQRLGEVDSTVSQRKVYILRFPAENFQAEILVKEVVVAYAQLSFIDYVTSLGALWVVQGQSDEIVLIKVRAEATAEIEAIWLVSVNLTGDKTLDEQNITQAKERRTGLKDFDAIGERYGLLWIERSYADKQLYGLHFPSGSPVEEIMAAYVQLPFIESVGPGRVPVELVVEKMTWGSIKYRMNYLTQEGSQ